MAYDDVSGDRNDISQRRSVDDETDASNSERRSYEPPQPAGWGCSKGCLYGMAGCGCLTVILAIVAGVVGWRFLSRSFSSDPAVVTATAREIADFDLPAELKPEAKFDFGVTKIVSFRSPDRASTLILTEVDTSKLPKGNGAPPAIDLSQQHGPQRLIVTKSELREMKIRGENGMVTFSEAKDMDSGAEYRIVKGRFQGKRGPAEFDLRMPKAKYKEEDVLKFVNGLK